jgi:diaminopimelate decarboxylase
MKANPDEGILRECLNSEINFDCASMGEIKIMLRLGA